MTYQQIFDEALGAPPPTSVDLDGIMVREARRGRLRRLGAYGTAAGAVVAVAVGIGVVVTDRPAVTMPGIVAASSSEAPGDEANKARVRSAMLAAIDREVPGLRWVPDAEHKNMADWSGPTVTDPSWPVSWFSHQSASGWIGAGLAVRGDIRARFSIEISMPKAGQSTEDLTCSGAARACETSRGPNGERIRRVDVDGRRTLPDKPPTPTVSRWVEVFCPDGTQVRVSAVSSSAEFLLTVPEMTAIGLDPALTPR
ncbi:hypothetical protein [Micromonospora narathiwatensis]|uniref:Uncharacterized protein n=1 Tax=Micromonospora narathiwatensis TaxID=299146 RepID=A0A1A9AC86_9ACTN|nr:hypothetical protein [Micromonospora narathiwatensis]SBT53716.1 hypothetical protein GA0070621_4920 [Micromonospora narathiwatensis]